MSEQHNYRIISNKPLRIYDYFKTQQELDYVMKTRANRSHTAEFYQPGIGWVRYNPQPIDYAAIIKRLVAAGNQLTIALVLGADGDSVCNDWSEITNSAEVKKVLGEA